MANRLDGKGSARRVKLAKRTEAEERNAKTHPDKRRSHWRALGFVRESEASAIVRRTVAEANAIADDIREKSGMKDWRPLVELQ